MVAKEIRTINGKVDIISRILLSVLFFSLSSEFVVGVFAECFGVHCYAFIALNVMREKERSAHYNSIVFGVWMISFCKRHHQQ